MCTQLLYVRDTLGRKRLQNLAGGTEKYHDKLSISDLRAEIRMLDFPDISRSNSHYIIISRLLTPSTANYFVLQFKCLWIVSLIVRSSPSPLVIFCNKLIFLRWGVVNLTPNTKLEDYLLSALRHCLFNIFAATLRIWKLSSPSATCGPHSVVKSDPPNMAFSETLHLHWISYLLSCVHGNII
jgi:hypothetical protein